MNKKLKRLVFALVLFGIYILFIMNIHRFRFLYSMLNIYNQNKNTPIVIELPEERITQVTNPLDNIIKPNEDNYDKQEPSNNENIKVENKDVNSKDVEKSNQKPAAKPSNKDTKPIKPYLSIIEEYNKKLKALQDTFMTELDNLIEQGILEYKEGKTSSFNLMIKYMNEGAKLEKKSDLEFSSIIKSLENELRTNGHDTVIINEIKNYYETLKKFKKEDLISRGMKYVRN